jgi:predicted peptidase
MKKTILAAGMAVVLFMTGCGSAVSQQPDSQQSVVAETATGSENASGSTVSANESTSQSMGSSTAAGGPQGVQQGNGGMGADTDYKKEDTVLQSMISEVVPKFKQFTYTDSETGKTLTYNLYIPDGYNPSKSYPLVYFLSRIRVLSDRMRQHRLHRDTAVSYGQQIQNRPSTRALFLYRNILMLFWMIITVIRLQSILR